MAVGYKHRDRKLYFGKKKDWYRTTCFGPGIYVDSGYKQYVFQQHYHRGKQWRKYTCLQLHRHTGSCRFLWTWYSTTQFIILELLFIKAWCIITVAITSTISVWIPVLNIFDHETQYKSHRTGQHGIWLQSISKVTHWIFGTSGIQMGGERPMGRREAAGDLKTLDAWKKTNISSKKSTTVTNRLGSKVTPPGGKCKTTQFPSKTGLKKL